MNFQAGATVGFGVALAGLGGLIFGALFADLAGAKNPGQVAAGLGAVGGLMGAVVAGALVAPDATTTTGTGTSGPPRITQHRYIPPQLNRNLR